MMGGANSSLPVSSRASKHTSVTFVPHGTVHTCACVCVCFGGGGGGGDLCPALKHPAAVDVSARPSGSISFFPTSQCVFSWVGRVHDMGGGAHIVPNLRSPNAAGSKLVNQHTHTLMEAATVVMDERSLPRLMVIVSAPHFLPQV